MNVTATGSSTAGSGSVTDAFNFGEQKELFLQLLVAQLKNQDPTSPMDQKEMLGQMAQFTTVEQMTNMAKTLEAMQVNSVVSQGIGMIGHEVDYLTGTDGIVATSTVTGVSTGGSSPQLVLSDGSRITVSEVVLVR